MVWDIADVPWATKNLTVSWNLEGKKEKKKN